MKRIRFLFFALLFSGIYTTVFSQSKAVFLDQSSLWADSVLLELSNEEKIAQLFMIVAYSNKGDSHKQEIANLIKKYNVGGVMFLQGGPVRQARLTNYFQTQSKIPLMVAIDAEWGVSMRLDSVVRFPWQMTLGAIKDPNLVYQMGVAIANQCKSLGIHINFAPVVDVNSNPNNPIINNRSFGEDPYKVAKLGIAYMKGMQDNNVLACAKHFPGHGDTDKDSHKTLPLVSHSRDRLNSMELIPFKQLIDHGLGSIMVAHLNIPSLDNQKDLPTSLSYNVVTGLLRKDLGFTGLSITDALNMKGVSEAYSPGLVDLKALLAGNDILLFSSDVAKAIEEIKNAIEDNQITQKEIDDRCKKVLMAKKWMGLDKYKPVDIASLDTVLVNKDTELLDKKLVKSSLTLLQNYDDLIPLKRLDTLSIASVSIGDDFSAFQDMLSNYAPVDHFNIGMSSTINEQALLLEKLRRYNLVIISIHKSNKTAWSSYKIERDIDVLIQSIALNHKVVVNIFANPYSINSLLFTNNFDGLLLSYQNSLIAQEQSAQAIFGGIAIRGRLPVTTKHFKINKGLDTESIRMSYVTPEEIGFNSSLLYKIDSIALNAIEQKATPGCQILIAQKGKIFFHKSFGYHTYSKNDPVSNEDIYDLASITKIAATTPILMKMVDSDEFDLYDKLGNYLDIDSIDKQHLVIREILSHQARLFPWIPFYKSTLEQDSLSGLVKLKDTLYSNIESSDFPYKVADEIYLHFSYKDSIISRIYESDLLEEKEYYYSDLGFYLFKEIIEKNYGESLDQIVQSDFYKGLGMENLGYLPLERISKERIVPTEDDFKFRGQLLKGYVHDMGAALQGGVGGHAGLFSNANDLAKLMQMYLQGGTYAGERYLSEEVINEFTRCQYCDQENRRGAGFDKPALENQEGGSASRSASPLSFGHSGFTGTLAWADPATEIVYIFLSNRIHPDDTNKKLLDMNVRTEIMDVIFKSVDEE